MGRNNNTDKAITKSARNGYFGMYNCKPIEDTTTKRSKQHISYLMRSRHRASVCKNDLYNTIEIKTFNTKSDTLIHQLAIPHLNININNPPFGYGTTIMNEGAMILDFINPQNDDQHRKNSIELLVGESTKRTRKNSVVDVVDLRNIDYDDDIQCLLASSFNALYYYKKHDYIKKVTGIRTDETRRKVDGRMTLEYNYLINGNSEKISSKCADVEIKRTAIRWILNPPPNK